MKPNDPLYYDQWHFGLIGDVEALWDDYDGNGITVVVYDDGMDYAHADLAGNYEATGHFTDSNNVTYDPGTPGSAHGTAVAGLIGAEGDNAEGGTGVASGVTLTGVNFVGDLQFQEDAIVIESLEHAANFDIMNNSWGELSGYGFDWNYLPGFFAPLVDPDPAGSIGDLGSRSHAYEQAYRTAVETGREGSGTIIVQASGNDGINAGGYGLNNSRFNITVGATEEDGQVASYSNWGTSLLVSAPAASVTTDLSGTEGVNTLPGSDGDYMTTFNGTSAATPVVSGVVALMLEANPNLGWRDVQNILALSASLTGSDYGGPEIGSEVSMWSANGATNWNGGGNAYNLSYGFGMVDAFAAVRMAEVWFDLHPEAQDSFNELIASGSYTGGSVAISDAVGSNDPGDGTAVSITVLDDIVIENIQVTFDITHTNAEDLVVWLVAPDLTEIQIMVREGLPDIDLITSEVTEDYLMQDGFNWTFEVTAYLGMMSAGEWGLRVGDYERNGSSGTINDFSLDFYGSVPTTDTVYHYTSDFLEVAAVEEGRQTLDTEDGGTDWLNFVSIADHVVVDLSFGEVYVDELLWQTIDPAVTIENVMTGDGDDFLVGNAFANELHGGRGTDILIAFEGDDLVFGGQGDDWLVDGAGSDVYIGGLGIDTVEFQGTVDHFTAQLGTEGDFLMFQGSEIFTGANALAEIDTDIVDASVEILEFFDGSIDFAMAQWALSGAPEFIEIWGSVALFVDPVTGHYTLFDGTSEVGLVRDGLPVTPIAPPTMSMIQADLNASGGFDVLWLTDTGGYDLWTFSSNGTFQSSSEVTDIRNHEPVFRTDIDGDGLVGFLEELVEENGPVDLFTDNARQYTLLTGNTNIGVTRDGDAVKTDYAPGMSMVQAASSPSGGFDVLWAHDDGTYSMWTLNSAGAFQSSSEVSDVRRSEIQFEVDIDGDGWIGLPEVIEANGAVELIELSPSGEYFLADGDLQIGITRDGVAVTSGYAPGWTMIQAERAAEGGYNLLWKNVDGSHIQWIVDAEGELRTYFDVTNLRELEFLFEADLDGDEQVGVPEVVVEANGSVELTVNSTGEYILLDGALEIGVTRDGVVVTTDYAEGWTMIHAEDAAEGGYNLLWQNVDGSHIQWIVDAEGELQTYFDVPDVSAVEVLFEADLDGDGDNSVPEVVVEINGSVDLKVNSRGEYVIVDGALEIGLTQNEAPVVTGFFGEGWEIIQAEDAPGGGYYVLMKYVDGTHVYWTADETGALQAPTNVPEVSDIEPLFEADLDGDGVVSIPEVVVETNGLVDLKVNSRGEYVLLSNVSKIGVTQDGAAVRTDHAPGWTMTQAEEAADGGYNLLWENVDGSYIQWILDAAGELLTFFGVSDVRDVEPLFDVDLTGDEQVGVPEVVVEINGSVELKVSNTNQFVLVDGATEIGVTQDGFAVTTDHAPGWTMTQAEDAADGGYNLLWENVDGSHIQWILDTEGALQTYFGVADVRDVEPLFEVDLDGDEQVGVPELIVETNGSVDLKVSNTDQFVFIDGETEIGVTLNGVAVTTDFAPGWTMTQAEDGPEGGYNLLWENIDGSYIQWTIDAAGELQTYFGVPDVRDVEPLFEVDLNGDGTLGHELLV